MYDPIMRVLTVLEVLQARDFVSGSELAERLEVDLRTVLGAARERASLHGGVVDASSGGDARRVSARLPLVSAHG